MRLAVAQIRPDKGDYSGNLSKIATVVKELCSSSDPPDLIVFPETITSGYFLEGGVRDVAVAAGTLFTDISNECSDGGGSPGVDLVRRISKPIF